MVRARLPQIVTPITRKTNKFISRNKIYTLKSNSMFHKQRMTTLLFLRPAIISETSSVWESRQEKLRLSTFWLSSIERISVVKRSMKND